MAKSATEVHKLHFQKENKSKMSQIQSYMVFFSLLPVLSVDLSQEPNSDADRSNLHAEIASLLNIILAEGYYVLASSN
jgi:hypothetical protein